MQSIGQAFFHDTWLSYPSLGCSQSTGQEEVTRSTRFCLILFSSVCGVEGGMCVYVGGYGYNMCGYVYI